MSILLHRQHRSIWIFLLIGILIRVWNIGDPIIDAMYPRQGQTADAVRSLIEEPGIQLDSNASWRGTEPARIIQELPVYSYITQGLYEVLAWGAFTPSSPKPGGADPSLIDIAGRLVSILFWAISFLLVQMLWARFLTVREAFWANGVFVFAPLSVFYGQAVMLEMVFLSVCLTFVLAVLRYSEKPTMLRFALLAFFAMLGCLMKFPPFSLLGLLAIAILWRSQGFKFLFRPVHFLGAILVVAAMKVWSGYVTSTNMAAFSFWTSEESLRLFLGTFHERIAPGMYVRIAAYIATLILSPAGVIFATAGLFHAWKRKSSEAGFFVLAWCGSLVAFVLIWGAATASKHSYYNLPFLAPSAMLLAMGIVPFIDWLHSRCTPIRTRALIAVLVVAILFPMALMSAYLFREDKVLLVAVDWIKANVPAGEPIAVKLNHRSQTIEYMHIPIVGYYSGRPCFMLTEGTPVGEYDLGLRQCRYVVETLPEKPDVMLGLAIWIKGAERQPDPLTKVKGAGFVAGVPLQSGIRIWAKPD